jgi:hypothetical protein
MCAATFRLAMKYMVGTRNVTPMTRPQRRWVHSIQYICLNSESDILGFNRMYSGEARYRANSASQSAADSGGSDPVTGLHSVMLNLPVVSQVHIAQTVTHPDSVSLVSPPNTTIPNTLAALPSNQYATAFSLVSGNDFFRLESCDFEIRGWDSSVCDCLRGFN